MNILIPSSSCKLLAFWSLVFAAIFYFRTRALAASTVYGKLHVSLDHINQKKRFTGWTLNHKILWGNLNDYRRASHIGITGTQDLGILKAVYQMEIGIPIVNTNIAIDNNLTDGDPHSLYMRNSYIGLQGKFGTILAGRHDTPLKNSTQELDLFDDTIADKAQALWFKDFRFDNTILYKSSAWKGLSFSAAIIPGSASTIECGMNNDNDTLANTNSIAVTYRKGPWYASVARDQMDVQISTINEDLKEVRRHGFEKEYRRYRYGLGMLNYHNFTLTGLYEKQKGLINHSSWLVNAGYTYGNNTIKAMFGGVALDHRIHHFWFHDAYSHNLGNRD